MTRLALLLAAMPLLFAGSADAVVVTGHAIDPAGDSTSGSGTDIVEVHWEFDPDAGRVRIAVTFAGTTTAEDWGAINGSLRDNSAPGCEGLTFAQLRGSNNASSASLGAGNIEDGQQPDGSTGPSTAQATNTRSADGRTTILEGSHPRLVGRKAACMLVNISHKGVLDSLPGVVAGETPDNPGGSPPPVEEAPPGAGSPGSIRLASGARLRFRRGSATVTLTGAAPGTTGRVRITVAGNVTLASARYSAPGPEPVRVKLFLTRRGGRWLFRHPRGGRGRLTLTSELGAETRARRYSVRIR